MPQGNRRGRPPKGGTAKVQTYVRLEPALLDSLKERARELSARSPADVTVSDVIRIACHYYTRTAPPDAGHVFGPDVWVRT